MDCSIYDAHTDFLMNLRLGRVGLDADIGTQQHISLPSLIKGNVGLQIFAAFTGNPQFGHPLLQAIEQIQRYRDMLHFWQKSIVPIRTINELKLLVQKDTIRSVLALEGGEAACGSLAVLDILHLLDVRIVTLLWNRENEIGFPAAHLASTHEKLKPFGRECIEFFGKKGMGADVSHLNIGGFWEVMERSSKPVMASHSNAHALCPHPRNLNDDQIKAIVRNNGFIGLNFYPPFLTEQHDSVCTADDIVRNALHILDLGGEDVLGLGSDFDGISATPKGIEGAQSFPAVLRAFEQAGINKDQIEKIARRNLERYLSLVLPHI